MCAYGMHAVMSVREVNSFVNVNSIKAAHKNSTKHGLLVAVFVAVFMANSKLIEGLIAPFMSHTACLNFRYKQRLPAAD